LGDGTAWLTARTGVPTLGVVPYRKLPLPEEDAHTLTAARVPTDKPVIAILRFPSVSNFDEFDPLRFEPGVAVRWVDRPEGLGGAAAVILPGSKHVAADGAWLHRTGLAAAVRGAAARVPVLGVCGGLQLLGHRLSDPHGVEGGEAVAGLGLLDVETVLAPDKTTRLSAATLLETGETVSGYEIHHGRTRAGPDAVPYLSDGLGYRQGNVMGVYLHGLFENTAFRRLFLRALGVAASEADWGAQVDAALDALADHLEVHLDMERIDEAAFGKRHLRRQGRLVLVTGGARSGKSRYAEALVTHYAGGSPVLYLATLEAGDEEMVARIARHRERRPARWRTVETPLGVADALKEADERVVLLDCLSGFVSNLLLGHEAAPEALTTILGEVDALLEAVQTSRKVVVVVTNEVGSGVVPAYPLGRLYRDALGLANARVAAAADAVALTVVGLPQVLKGHLPEVSLDS